MSLGDRNSVFAALADENRRWLLERLLQKNGQSLAALTLGSGISRQGISKHLKILEAANLVQVQRRGRTALHFLNPVPLHVTAMRWLALFGRINLGALRPDEDS